LNDLDLSDPIREDLEEICEAGQRASDLTKQLLAFSRRQFLEPKVLNLNTVIHNLQKMLHRIIGEDIRLVTSFDKHLRNVKADPVQLEQIIINLAVNAREAMSGGGSLTIKTENLEIDQDCAGLDMPSEPGQYVKVTISDTGTGMVEEIRLVLTDVVMPDKDGKELADEIISRKLDVKIMYMSGYTDDAIVQHGIIKTDIPFLQKPFTPKQLTSKIP
jgi:signal transduction histidine kinase